MPKFSVHAYYTEDAYLTIEADDEEQAQIKAEEMLDNGEAQLEGAYGEPDWQFEIESAE